jgi:hypothetical protein
MDLTVVAISLAVNSCVTAHPEANFPKKYAIQKFKQLHEWVGFRA